MTAPAIRIRKLSRYRGTGSVLSDVDLEVFKGEFVGLLGVNGAGKTTLLKCLLDLDAPDSGEITIFNSPHNRFQARQGLVWLPENFRPPAWLSGREFLTCLCRLYGNEPEHENLEQIPEALDLPRTALDTRCERLSAGTAQKLGLAACLLSGSRLLILDEPLNGLDPVARSGLQRHLLRLKRRGCTCLFATHLLADAEQLCDRVAILHQGKICYAGAPADLRRKFNGANLEQAFLRCIGAGEGVNGGYIEH